jgi:hypothetical protein
MCPLTVLPFVAAFCAFNKVVESCFGCVLLPEFAAALQEFRARYVDLEIAVTPKVHAVFHHVSEFCSRRGTGLGLWSEQAAESLHCDFLRHWQRYSVPAQHELYPERLLAAVNSYNSRHV